MAVWWRNWYFNWLDITGNQFGKVISLIRHYKLHQIIGSLCLVKLCKFFDLKGLFCLFHTEQTISASGCILFSWIIRFDDVKFFHNSQSIDFGRGCWSVTILLGLQYTMRGTYHTLMGAHESIRSTYLKFYVFLVWCPSDKGHVWWV